MSDEKSEWSEQEKRRKLLERLFLSCLECFLLFFWYLNWQKENVGHLFKLMKLKTKLHSIRLL